MSKATLLGDHFMASEVFDQAPEEGCGDSSKLHSRTLPWPDAPMTHEYGARISPGYENSCARPLTRSPASVTPKSR